MQSLPLTILSKFKLLLISEYMDIIAKLFTLLRIQKKTRMWADAQRDGRPA